MSEIWKPAVTVAAIIERNGLFFMIEEDTSEGRRINQPAGHLDPGESLIDAVIRETKEETAHEFIPSHLVGIYLSRYVSKRHGLPVSYLRFAFAGELGDNYQHSLDVGIVRTMWMSYDELIATKKSHRSELIMKCVDDYLAGAYAPLSFIHTENNVTETLALSESDVTDISELKAANTLISKILNKVTKQWQKNA
ncbi:MAG: MutT/NUDIX family hydrolase [Solimicrobium sp.]|nr:MutT/NUDIX family hydrolase [Solimicrobium sp.]